MAVSLGVLVELFKKQALLCNCWNVFRFKFKLDEFMRDDFKTKLDGDKEEGGEFEFEIDAEESE